MTKINSCANKSCDFNKDGQCTDTIGISLDEDGCCITYWSKWDVIEAMDRSDN